VTFLVLLGAPGAGKGTQAAILSERLGIPHVATGDLFRSAVRERSAIGLEARRFMERGHLVPDDITVRMLLSRLADPDAQDGVILDGFPRTVAQAEALDTALDEHGARVDQVLEIDVPPEELVRRMSGRWICEANGHVYNETTHPPKVPGVCDLDGSPLIQREDDREATIRARLDQQLDAMREVSRHYRDQGILHIVDGQRSIDEVARDLLAAVQPTVRRGVR
jgi:adenylate kinase